MAASAAGAAMGAQANKYLSDDNAFGGLFKGNDISRATAVGFAAGMTTAVAGGGKIDVVRIATDAFGNALGNSLAYQGVSTQAQKFAAMDARLNEVMGDVLANGYKLVSTSVPGYDEKDTKSTDSPLRTGEYSPDYTTVSYGTSSDGQQQVIVTGHRAPVIEPTPIEIDPSIFELPSVLTVSQIPSPTIDPLNSAPTQSPVFLRGKLSEQYETSGRGPAVVSSGKGDPGGVSYGSYQFSSKRGVVNEFLRANGSKWLDNFVNLDPTIPNGEFAKNWKQIAKQEPKAFFLAQHTYVERNYYDTKAKLISKKTGLDINVHSRAVQDTVWSTAVQQGQFSSAVVNAVKTLNGVDRSSPDFDERLINAIYDERSKLDKNGNLVYFKSSKLDVQAGIKLRYVNERRDALEMLRDYQLKH